MLSGYIFDPTFAIKAWYSYSYSKCGLEHPLQDGDGPKGQEKTQAVEVATHRRLNRKAPERQPPSTGLAAFSEERIIIVVE